MPQRIIAGRDVAYRRATSRIVPVATPVAGAIAAGVNTARCARNASKPLVRPATKPASTRPSSTITCSSALSSARAVSGRNRRRQCAWRASSLRRGSMPIGLVPRATAFLIQLAATGWFTVGFAPITIATSACSTSITGLLAAPEPTPSSSAATEEAWHSLMQWSTLSLPEPVGTSLWNRYPSSLPPLAEPKPAGVRAPCASPIDFRAPAARSGASSQVASRKTSPQACGSRLACASSATATR
jgi:hypothetical protein